MWPGRDPGDRCRPGFLSSPEPPAVSGEIRPRRDARRPCGHGLDSNERTRTGTVSMKSHRNLSQTSRSSCELLQSAKRSARHSVSVYCTLTCGPPDSLPSSLAICGPAVSAASRELLQSAKRPARHSVSVYCTLTCGPPDPPPSSPARHSVSGVSEDVLHDLYL